MGLSELLGKDVILIKIVKDLHRNVLTVLANVK